MLNAAQDVTYPAFTVRAHNYTVCGEQKKKLATRYSITAQRGDGTRVKMREVDGAIGSKVRTVTHRDKTEILDDIGFIKTTLATKPPLRLDPATDCTKSIDGTPQPTRIDGFEEILGIKTVKLVADLGGRVVTDWRAPSLGCESLQAVLSDKKTGECLGSTEAFSIELGEPHPSLFLVPPVYKEVSWADGFIAQAKRKKELQGKTLSTEEERVIRDSQLVTTHEKAYHAERPK